MTLDELLASPDYQAAAPEDRMRQIDIWGTSAKEENPTETRGLDEEIPKLRAREYVSATLPTIGIDKGTAENFRDLYLSARRPSDSHEPADWQKYDQEYQQKQKDLMAMPDPLRTKYHAYRQMMDTAGKHYQTAEEARNGMQTSELDYGDGVTIPTATQVHHDRKDVTVTYPDGTHETFEYAHDEPPPDADRLRTFMVEKRPQHLAGWGDYLGKLPNFGAHAGNAMVNITASGLQFADALAGAGAQATGGGKTTQDAATTMPLFVQKQTGPDGLARWVKRPKPEVLSDMPDADFRNLQTTALDLINNEEVSNDRVNALYTDPRLSKIIEETNPPPTAEENDQTLSLTGQPFGNPAEVENRIMREQTEASRRKLPEGWLDETKPERDDLARRLLGRELNQTVRTRDVTRPFKVDPSNLLATQEDQKATTGSWAGARVVDWLGDKAFNVPTVGQAVGSSLPTMAAAVVGGPLAALPFAGLMGASEGNQAYEDVLQRNLTAGIDADTAKNRALGAGAAYGAISTVLEEAGSVFEAGVFERTIGKTPAGRAIMAFVPESAEESSQQIAQDLISNANLPEEQRKKASQMAQDALEAGAGALSFGVVPAIGGIRKSVEHSPAGKAANQSLNDPTLPAEAKAAVGASTDLAVQAEALKVAAQQAAAKAPQKAPESKVEASQPIETTETTPDAAQARAAEPLVYSDEAGDALYQNGAWVLPDGTAATNAQALEAQRQQYIQTGDLPEGMQATPQQEALMQITPSQPEGSVNETTPQATHATTEQQEQSSLPAEREGGDQSRETPEASGGNSLLGEATRTPEEVTPTTPIQPVATDTAATGTAKERPSRIGRKKTAEQRVMGTREFRDHPEVANDIISKIKGNAANFLKPPRLIVQKEAGQRRRLELAPENRGGEWDWYRPLLENPVARQIVDDAIFSDNAGTTLDTAAQNFGMRGDELGDAIAHAALNRSKLAGQMAKGETTEAHDQSMQGTEAQTVAFEGATKKGKGKRALSTTGMEPGETFEVDGETVTVTDVDRETGDVTLQDGTKFGRQTLASGEDIWVEKKGGTQKQEASVMPFSAAEENEADAPHPNPVMMRYSQAKKRASRRVIAKGVTEGDVRTAMDALARMLPNVRTAWVGTLKQLQEHLRRDTVFQRRWKDTQRLITGQTEEEADKAFHAMVDSGLKGREGFTFLKRTYLIADEIRTLEADGNAANAVRRVLIHEDAHEGLQHLRDIDPDVDTAWQNFRNAIPAEELDSLAKRYTWLADWRDDPRIHDDMANEWFAKRIEEAEQRGRPAKDSLVGRFMDWLKDVVHRLIGGSTSVTDQSLVAFMDAARAARFRDDAEAASEGLRFAVGDSDGNLPARRVVQIQTANGEWEDVLTEKVRKPLYNRWSEDKQKEYEDYQNNKNVPESLKYFAQFLGSKTGNKRLTQSIGPMIMYARNRLGGDYGESPEVNEENIESAWEIAKKMLSNKTFAAKYISDFQRDVSEIDPESKLPLHQGQAAAAVLQLELMDFAVNVLAKTGDMRLYKLMAPMANDTIIGDYATMSSAARLLNVRSVALRTKGLWSALKSVQNEIEKKADEKYGAADVAAVKDAVDPNENHDLKDEIHEQWDEHLDKAGKAEVEQAAQAEADYDPDGAWKRVRGTLGEEEQALMVAFQASLMKLNRLLQQQELRKAQAGSKIQASLAEDAGKWESDEDLDKAIEAEQAHFLELLHKLTKQESSEIVKYRRQKMLKDKRVQKAVKHLSANKEAAASLDRFKNRNKRLQREKSAWRSIFDEQIRNPEGEDAFKAKVTAAGITEQMSKRLFDLADQIAKERTEKRSASQTDKDRLTKARDKAKQADQQAHDSAKDASQYEEEAQRIIENATKEPKEAKAQSPLKEAQRKFVNGEISEREFKDKAASLGVTGDTLETLTDISQQETERRDAEKTARKAAKDARAEQERINRAIDVYNKNLDGKLKATVKNNENADPRLTDTKAFISSIARQLTAAPVASQNDPAWVKSTVEQALMERGLPTAEAKVMAAKLAHKYDDILKEAQAKAATDAGEKMKMKKPTIQSIGAAIRTGAINPLHPNPAVQAIATQLGFKNLSAGDYKLLAELDALTNSGFPTQGAKAHTLINRLLSKAKGPKGVWDVIAQVYRNGALGTLGVQFLNWTAPVFQVPTMLMTDIMGYGIDAARGKGSRVENLKAIGTAFTNMWRARQNWYNQAKFSIKNDAYQNQLQEYMTAEAPLYGNIMQALDEIKNIKTNPAKGLWGATKMLWLSTDWVRRLMASADGTWSHFFQNALISNEAIRTLIQEGGMTAEGAMSMVEAAGRDGAAEQATQIAAGGAPEEAALIGADVTKDEIAKAVARMTGDPEKGIEVLTTAKKTAEMNLGNRSPEQGAKWDLVSHLLEVVAKGTAAFIKKKLPLLGTPLVGFTSVASNMLDRGTYFTPYGWLRLWAKTKNKDLYKETMATEGMARQRAIEPLVSLVALGLLAALRYDPDEPDDWGIYVSGMGPTDPDQRQAWEALHKAGQIEFIWNRKVQAAIPYTRGGFEHMAVPLTFMGAVNDMQASGRKANGHSAEYAAMYAQTAGSNLLKQAQFYGLRNLMSSTPTSTTPANMARSAAYMTNPLVPWGGTIKSISALMTGPQDASSTRSAILSQIPVLQPIFGSPEPKLNFLGDPIGYRTDDAAQIMMNRLGYAGLPFWVNLPETSPDLRVYEFMMKKGIAPSMPVRSLLEKNNGLISDSKWARYVKTRGRIIKTELKLNMDRIRSMSHQDADDELNKISRAATKEAKSTLNLK